MSIAACRTSARSITPRRSTPPSSAARSETRSRKRRPCARPHVDAGQSERIVRQSGAKLGGSWGCCGDFRQRNASFRLATSQIVALLLPCSTLNAIFANLFNCAHLMEEHMLCYAPSHAREKNRRVGVRVGATRGLGPSMTHDASVTHFPYIIPHVCARANTPQEGPCDMVRHATWSIRGFRCDESAALPIPNWLPLQSQEHVTDAPLLRGPYLRGIDVQSGSGNFGHSDRLRPTRNEAISCSHASTSKRLSCSGFTWSRSKSWSGHHFSRA